MTPDATATSSFQCIIYAHEFWRASLAQFRDLGRPYLAGVRIEPCPEGGVLLIATDGIVMVCIRDEHGFVYGSATIDLDQGMLDACEADDEMNYLLAVAGGQAVILDLRDCAEDDGKAEFLTFAIAPPTQGLVRHQCADVVLENQQYPDWRKVWFEPKDGYPMVASFNADLLENVAMAICKEGTGPLRIVPTGRDVMCPHILFSDAPHRIGMIMPMRGTDDGTPIPAVLPDWLMVPF